MTAPTGDEIDRLATVARNAWDASFPPAEVLAAIDADGWERFVDAGWRYVAAAVVAAHTEGQ